MKIVLQNKNMDFLQKTTALIKAGAMAAVNYYLFYFLKINFQPPWYELMLQHPPDSPPLREDPKTAPKYKFPTDPLKK